MTADVGGEESAAPGIPLEGKGELQNESKMDYVGAPPLYVRTAARLPGFACRR